MATVDERVAFVEGRVNEQSQMIKRWIAASRGWWAFSSRRPRRSSARCSPRCSSADAQRQAVAPCASPSRSRRQ